MNQFLRINLLDWREARRERRQQMFFKVLGGCALIAAGIVFLVITFYNRAIESQEQRNRFIQAEIAKIDKQITEIKELEKTRNDLITRMRIIEQLQQSRAQIVHYFEQVVETLPEGVHLTSLKQSGKKTNVNGVAESNGRVSTYMVNIDDSKWFADPRLVVIKSSSKNRRRAADFTLTFKSVTPKPDADETPDDTGGTP